ncbi:MAG: hypothetical protein QG636_39 [Patescibacteria group bacterium]|jgi:hypothetical protein|nr:hypothetical protein [Patescibacteria group bacterium]
MTKRNLITILKSLRNLTLSVDAKKRIRADISAYADLHSLTDLVKRLPVRSPFSYASFMVPVRSLYAGALALVLVVAGGTQASLASVGSVPGDILYPLKVSVSEPLSFVLTPSTEGRAALAAEFASRRVDEAVALSSVGKLDEQTAEDLATRFDTHVDVLAKETDTLEAKGEIATSLAVRTDLEQKLSARVEEFAVDAEIEGDAMIASSVVAEESTEDRFTTRVFEKSKTLATTRERLETALALDVEAELKDGGSLAAIRPADAEEGDVASAGLFFAKVGSGDFVDLAATTTASTTATTTDEDLLKGDEATESAASRFFAPFLKR